MGAALALGVAILATLSAVFVMCPVSADADSYDGTIDLYGYKITMGLIEPDQVSSVEWDFGDGSAKETVQITSENPVGKVQHTYSAKGDYVVTATMRNQYTNSEGQLVDGEAKLTYLYHIHGYPIVTFESNGGSAVAQIEGTSAHYVPAKPADPVYEGHTFSGWFVDSECTQAFDWTSEVTKHTTLYAGWDLITHTVSFDYDGGVGTASETVVTDGKTITAPADPTKEGFDFDGWYLGDEKFDFATPIKSDITLIAHWKEAVTFAVTFESDGSALSVQHVVEGKTATAPENPTKEGFEFDGWYNGDVKFDFATPITSDLTLKAHWKEASEPSVPSEDDKNDDNGSDLWKIFAVVAALCVFAMLVTGFYIAGIPAVFFAILAIVSYLGVI